MSLKKISSLIYTAKTEKQLKKYLGEDFKFLDKMLIVLDELQKDGIDIGVTFNKKTKVVEAAIGENGKFISTLDDLFLKDLTEIKQSIGVKLGMSKGITSKITNKLNEHGFMLSLNKSKIDNEIMTVVTYKKNKKMLSLEALILGITSIGYMKRKKKLSKFM